MKKMQDLMTIGYEGRDIEEFVACLKESGVTRLVDVRDLPLSRKKGFSKNGLRARLSNEDIEYLHIRELGSPTSIRNKLKSDKDYESFFNAFSEHLDTVHRVVEEVAVLLREGNNCLLCFERDPARCHRSLVAQALIRTDKQQRLVHL